MNVMALFEKMIFTLSFFHIFFMVFKDVGQFLSEVLIWVIELPTCVILDTFLILSQHLKVENWSVH